MVGHPSLRVNLHENTALHGDSQTSNLSGKQAKESEGNRVRCGNAVQGVKLSKGVETNFSPITQGALEHPLNPRVGPILRQGSWAFAAQCHWLQISGE